MKSFHIYFIIIVLLSLSACSTKKQTLSLGTYYGKLPCADCPAINVQLQLNENGTYNLKTLYESKDKQVRDNSGDYAIQKDSILVLKSQKDGMDKFTISGENLKMLDKSGKPIVSEFSEKYMLTKKKPDGFSLEAPEISNAADFKATGNEPSWALTIDFDKNMHFKTIAPESFELTTPVPAPQKAQDANVTRYYAETEAGILEVSVLRKTCSDDMSGKNFDYSVKVRAKIGTMEDYQDFSGCGSFLGTYRLNNLWELERINENNLDKPNEKKPHLEFDLAQNKMYGFGGCNRLNGTVKLEKDSLKIRKIASTKMACPNMEMESAFLPAISDKSFGMEFKDDKLILKNDAKQLVFKKVASK